MTLTEIETYGIPENKYKSEDSYDAIYEAIEANDTYLSDDQKIKLIAKILGISEFNITPSEYDKIENLFKELL